LNILEKSLNLEKFENGFKFKSWKGFEKRKKTLQTPLPPLPFLFQPAVQLARAAHEAELPAQLSLSPFSFSFVG
jgi:hypothetical protein